MASPEWAERGIYWSKPLPDEAWLDILVGSEDPMNLTSPCDATFRRADGQRFYGTFATAAMVNEALLRSDGYLPLRGWIAVESVSVDRIAATIDLMQEAGAIEEMMESIGPSPPLD
jgi:hypothetical protein